MTGIPGSIGFDIGEMVANAQKLIAATSALPPVSAVTANTGPSDAASGAFRHELRWTAEQLGREVLKISAEITSLEGAITAHQQSLAATDDAVEGDLTRLLGFIDSAPAVPSTGVPVDSGPLTKATPGRTDTASGTDGFE